MGYFYAGMGEFGDDEEGSPIPEQAGYYWRRQETDQPYGPFTSEQEAITDALANGAVLGREDWN